MQGKKKMQRANKRQRVGMMKEIMIMMAYR